MKHKLIPLKQERKTAWDKEKERAQTMKNVGCALVMVAIISITIALLWAWR